LYNAGSELNKTTGLYEMIFRQYDPVLARFTGVDPLAANFSSFSPYHYAYNNPVIFNDPSGANPNETGPGPGYYDGNSCPGCFASTQPMSDEIYGMSNGFAQGNYFGLTNPGFNAAVWDIITKLWDGVTLATGGNGRGTYSESGGTHYYNAYGQEVSGPGSGFNGYVPSFAHFKPVSFKTDKHGNNVKVRWKSAQQGLQDPRFGPAERANASEYTMRDNGVGIANLTWEFFSGLGPKYSMFGPDHPLTQGLRGSYIVGLARTKFALEGSNGLDYWDAPFGILGALATGGNLPGQFTGSARISIVPVHGGNIFIVNNTTSRHSFYAHNEQNIPRNASGLGPAEGNIYQRFFWFEKK